MPVIGGASPIPRAFMPVTTPPVSGAVYTNALGTNLVCYLTVTLNPTMTKSSSVTVEVSLDGVSWQQIGMTAIPKGINLTGVVQQLMFQCPASWYYRVTVSNAVAGSLVAIG